MDNYKDQKQKSIRGKLSALGSHAAKFFQVSDRKEEAQDYKPIENVIGQGTADKQIRKPVDGSSIRELVIKSINANLLAINEMKQYSKLSSDIRLKERSIREHIIKNVLPANSPAKDEFRNLVSSMKSYYSLRQAGQQDPGQVKELGLLEFKINKSIASRGDLTKLLKLAAATIKDIRNESKKAISANAEPAQLSLLSNAEKNILSGLSSTTDKVQYARIEMSQKNLLSSLLGFEKKLEQAEKESLLKVKGLIREPKPPVAQDRKVEKLIDFVKNHQVARDQRPGETERKAAGRKDKSKEQKHFISTAEILERIKSTLEKDKRLNNYDSRTEQRKALIRQVVKFSKDTSTDLEKRMSMSQAQPQLSKDLGVLNQLIGEAQQKIEKDGFKTRMKNIITENAKNLKFDKQKKTKKHKMGNH